MSKDRTVMAMGVRRQFFAILFILALLGSCACTRVSAAQNLPFIPPSYLNCLVVTPQQLVDAYGRGNIVKLNEAKPRYNNSIFVFQNIKITESMYLHLDEGYLWVEGDYIKCYLLDAKTLRLHRVGDRVDILGLNQGPLMNEAYLVFNNCIILPAGYAQFPVDGIGVDFARGY